MAPRGQLSYLAEVRTVYGLHSAPSCSRPGCPGGKGQHGDFGVQSKLGGYSDGFALGRRPLNTWTMG